MANGVAMNGANSSVVTTLMLRNVPTMYKQEMIMEEMSDVLGSPNLFDFLYLPWDSTRNTNCGFAFVNFVDERVADMAARCFHGRRFAKSGAVGKPCAVLPARVQGIVAGVEALIERVKKNEVRHDPIIFWKGLTVDVRELVHLHEMPKSPPMTKLVAPPGLEFMNIQRKTLVAEDFGSSSTEFCGRSVASSEEGSWPVGFAEDRMGIFGEAGASGFAFSKDPMPPVGAPSRVAHIAGGSEAFGAQSSFCGSSNSYCGSANSYCGSADTFAAINQPRTIGVPNPDDALRSKLFGRFGPSEGARVYAF